VRAAIALLLLLPGFALGQEGRAVLEARCASCHTMDPGAPPGPGPNLTGLAGRRVAGDPEFGYSPALEAARAEGRVWDGALLERFLADPEAMFPGLWMGENGLREAADRAAVARFLTGAPAAR
jgi:cytochrome c